MHSSEFQFGSGTPGLNSKFVSTLRRTWRTLGGMRYPKATREQLTAPTGRFRVLGVDVGADSESVYLIGDFDSLSAAKTAAMERSGPASPTFVYNERAELIMRYGSWH